MKKNKMMRLASSLLVAVLLTTSVISGTFAKYVTSNGGNDKARVAKFGVTITIEDDFGLFNTQYDKTDLNYAGTISVESQTTDRVVAPGNKGSMTFTITGKPEVATRVSIDVSDENNAIQLAAGTYTLGAGKFEASEKSVTTTEVYEPIKFYFGTKEANALTNEDYKYSLDALETLLETTFTKDYEPGYDLTNDGSYTLAWYWPFEGTFTVGTENVADFLDTYLGNEEPSQVESLDFSITVTQID